MNVESGREPIGFQVRSTPLLRRRGLRGEPIMVELAGSDLLLRGAEGGCLCIAADEVKRLRLGFEETKYSRVYLARIWLDSGEAPLVLAPVDRPARAYGAAMRGFARAVAAAGGLSRIELGLTFASAMALPLAVLAVALAGSGFAFFVWVDRGLWGAIGFATAMAALAALFAIRAFRLGWPRPVRSLDELEPCLPGE